MEPHDTIPIISSVTLPKEVQHGLLPPIEKMVAKLTNVQSEVLEASLLALVKSLAGIIDKLPDSATGFRVDTVTFCCGIDSAGKVALLGEMSATMKSGITITLKRG